MLTHSWVAHSTKIRILQFIEGNCVLCSAYKPSTCALRGKFGRSVTSIEPMMPLFGVVWRRCLFVCVFFLCAQTSIGRTRKLFFFLPLIKIWRQNIIKIKQTIKDFFFRTKISPASNHAPAFLSLTPNVFIQKLK